FRIENDQVLKFLGLAPRPGSYRYAINEFADKIELLEKEANRAHLVDPKQRDVFDTKIVELADHLRLYIDLATLRMVRIVPPQTAEEEWLSLLDAAHAAQESGNDYPAARQVGTVLLAYAQNDPEKFNSELEKYRKWLDEQMPQETRLADFE